MPSKEQWVLSIVHILLQIVQAGLAFGLIFIVMSQTNKDQGMGGALSGQNADSSRYKGGYEEKLDDLAKKLAYGFLAVSFLVAILGTKLG
jgi:protein translocase SecG subunit